MADSRRKIIYDELTNDPEGRGYSGMADDQARADDLNLVRKQRNRGSMTGSEVFQNVDATEYGALTDAQKQQVLGLCAIDNLDPFGAGASVIADIFPPAGTTITALQAARVEDISRAEELGVADVTIWDIVGANEQYS